MELGIDPLPPRNHLDALWVANVSDYHQLPHGKSLRYPIIRTNLLADELRWELCKQERTVENCLAVIVIVGR